MRDTHEAVRLESAETALIQKLGLDSLAGPESQRQAFETEGFGVEAFEGFEAVRTVEDTLGVGLGVGEVFSAPAAAG
jgi:hypothetical protein